MYSDFDKLFDAIKSSDKIVLAGHSNPDGDAIGSTMALALALEKLGKTPIVLFEDFSEKFNVIPNTSNVFKGDTSEIIPDLFISLDCGAIDRLNENALEVFQKAKVTGNIDHHISNNNFADFNIVDVKSTSTSEVIYTVINEMVEIDKDIASCIYAGIVYDTAGFKHIPTSSYTHKIASKAHDLGVDFNSIYDKMIGKHSVTEIEIFKKALENLKVDYDNKIIYSFITQEDIINANSSSKELGGIISYLISTNGMEIAIFAYEKEVGKVKISMRSTGFDVNQLASNFGGGGHIRAAGCKLDMDIHKSLDTIIEKIKETKNSYE